MLGLLELFSGNGETVAIRQVSDVLGHVAEEGAVGLRVIDFRNRHSIRYQLVTVPNHTKSNQSKSHYLFCLIFSVIYLVGVLQRRLTRLLRRVLSTESLLTRKPVPMLNAEGIMCLPHALLLCALALASSWPHFSGLKSL